MSLDQIVASKPKVKTVAPKSKPKKAAPVKAQRSNKTQVVKQPLQGGGKKARDNNRPRSAGAQPSVGSILDRLGTSSNNAASGTLVTLSKLHKGVTARDVAELCRTSGQTKRVDMKFNSRGDSIGIAEVTFARQSDAINCVKQLHGVTLDGTPMHVKLGSTGGRENPSNVSLHKEKNVRVGLFGTAGDGRGRSNSAGSVRVTVNPRSDHKVKLVQPFNGNKEKGRGAKGPKPKGKGPKGGNRAAAKPKSAADLDAEMDAYHGGSKAAAAPAAAVSSADLDAEMDAYMANK